MDVNTSTSSAAIPSERRLFQVPMGVARLCSDDLSPTLRTLGTPTLVSLHHHKGPTGPLIIGLQRRLKHQDRPRSSKDIHSLQSVGHTFAPAPLLEDRSSTGAHEHQGAVECAEPATEVAYTEQPLPSNL